MMDKMTPLAWFAALAPMPSEDEISMQHKIDRTRNPHNDHGKPPIRERQEIIADYKCEFAQRMLVRVIEIDQ